MSNVGPMPYTRLFAIAGLALMLVLMPALSAPGATEFAVPLQKTESHIDKQGCLNFTATAMVHAQLNDLFEALSHPEDMYGSEHSVFVGVPSMQAFTQCFAASPRFYCRKIIESDGPPGRGDDPNLLTWTEYGFDPQRHIIAKRIIGSTVRFVPTNNAEFKLSPVERGSATSVSYSSSRCWSSPMRGVLSTGIDWNQQWLKEEKESLSLWLFSAENYAHLIAQERVKRGTPAATSSRSPAPSALTPTPVAIATATAR